MNEKKTGRSVWKSPFKMGLLVLSALAYAPTCIFDMQLPGASQWLLCCLVIFIGSFLAAMFEPERFLETAAMPFFAVLVLGFTGLGFTGLGGLFFLFTMVFVLTASVLAAFLGSAARRIGNMITGLTRRNSGKHNHPPYSEPAAR